ncbi:hypothetical protein D3C75_1052760 [compost metagenome]
MSSSACALIVLDLFNSGIIKTNIRSEYLRQFSNTGALYSEGWLLSYEAGKRLWLKNKDKKYIEDDHFFGTLLKLDISFYSDSKLCRPIFELKSEEDIDLGKIFDCDGSIEDHFNFDDMDEEYFDAGKKDGDDDDDDTERFDDDPFHI